MSDSSRPRLDSWKEIARHLRRDVTTVIRWERQRGLPVHRVPGGGQPRVFAYLDELDRWMAGAALEPAPEAEAEDGNGEPQPFDSSPAATPDAPPLRTGARLTPMLFLLLAVLVAGGVTLAAALALTRVSAPPTQLAVSGNQVSAFDASGRMRWSYRFDARTITAPHDVWPLLDDLDGDRRPEAIVSLEIRPRTSTEAINSLVRFSAAGVRDWSVTPEDRVSFRDGTYGPPWSGSALATYRIADEARIAWAVHHYTWWPGLLLTFDAGGERLATFVNSGWIRSVVPSADGRHLFLSGISNRWNTHFFAVLDAARPAGHSPDPPGSPTECVSCPAGSPLRYVVFPRTDVSLQGPLPIAAPTVQTFEDGRVIVQVHQGDGPVIPTAIYELASDWTPQRVRFSDEFLEFHRRLASAGSIGHAERDCPELRGQRVQIWSPSSAWQDVRVPVQ